MLVAWACLRMFFAVANLYFIAYTLYSQHPSFYKFCSIKTYDRLDSKAGVAIQLNVHIMHEASKEIIFAKKKVSIRSVGMHHSIEQTLTMARLNLDRYTWPSTHRWTL